MYSRWIKLRTAQSSERSVEKSANREIKEVSRNTSVSASRPGFQPSKDVDLTRCGIQRWCFPERYASICSEWQNVSTENNSYLVSAKLFPLNVVYKNVISIEIFSFHLIFISRDVSVHLIMC